MFRVSGWERRFFVLLEVLAALKFDLDERESVCACLCVDVCVCVCMGAEERERERERERKSAAVEALAHKKGRPRFKAVFSHKYLNSERNKRRKKLNDVYGARPDHNIINLFYALVTAQW